MVFPLTGCAVLGRRCWGIPSLRAWCCTAAVVAAVVVAAAVVAVCSPSGLFGVWTGKRND